MEKIIEIKSQRKALRSKITKAANGSITTSVEEIEKWQSEYEDIIDKHYELVPESAEKDKVKDEAYRVRLESLFDIESSRRTLSSVHIDDDSSDEEEDNDSEPDLDQFFRNLPAGPSSSKGPRIEDLGNSQPQTSQPTAQPNPHQSSSHSGSNNASNRMSNANDVQHKEGSVEINATPVDVVTQSKEDECSNDYFHEVRSLEEHERAKSSSSDILWNEKTKDKDVSKQSDISVANELMKKTQLINNVIPRSINNKEEVLTCCDAQQNTVGNASYTNGNHVVKKSKLVARSKNIARIYKSQSLYELRDVILKLLLYFMMELVQVFSNARINPNQDVGKVDAISVKVTSLERCWDDRSNMKRTCEHTNKVLKWKDKIADAGHQTQLTTNTSAVDHRQTQEFTLDIYRQKFGSKRFVAGDLGRNLVETTSCRPGGCC
ncbi:hypothetical protein RDWZM_009297 [Blomia tropicalis]|uniref:Uncharacterized protein n=1 Tax=Blomia tropicalis TaxID=40697 RepID=A0A9Q0RL68_BLOTA|nr:hypothetical protein RDWZM_009297 [Blomia tropicalis]